MKLPLLGVLIAVFAASCLVTEGLMFAEDEDVNITAILDQVLIGYDKRVRPNYGKQPVTVGVSLYILSMLDFSEQNMDFTFDMYFRQFWHDPRLGHRQRLIEASLSSGNYSRLLADVQFNRASGHYLIQIFLPTILIVMMSWLVFWLSPEHVSARVGLCAVAILALSTLMVSAKKELPKISYLKALDIYLVCAWLYLLGALMECVFVSYIAQALQASKNKDSQQDPDRKLVKAKPQQGLQKILLVLKPTNIDLFSKIWFPIAFVCFNIMFWMVYRSASKEVIGDLILLN